MMGMGEPLANYDNVMEAVRRMHNELGTYLSTSTITTTSTSTTTTTNTDEIGIGARHITISTVGLAPRIR